MDVFQICAIGLCGVILASLVRAYKPEMALFVVIGTVILIFCAFLQYFTGVFDFLESLYSRISYGNAFYPIMLKVIAIAYVTDFTAQICKDAKEGAIAGKIELAGKVFIFYVSIPVMMSVIELLERLLPG